jgi:hypothetical protein
MKTTKIGRAARVLAVLAIAFGFSLALPGVASADDTSTEDVSPQYENMEIVYGYWNCEATRIDMSEWAWVDPHCLPWDVNRRLYYFTWTCRIC